MSKLIIVITILSVANYVASAQHASQILQASTSAALNVNQLIQQSLQQLRQIYRTSEIKLGEIQRNRNLNEALKQQELVGIRRLLKNQIANWRSTLSEKIAFLERDMQNAVDLIFEKPVNSLGGGGSFITS